MTRCDYDTIFQRVFCVTLVAIAFTFTVILTNVFIDIDGLLSRKDRAKTDTSREPILDNEKHIRLLPNAIAPQPFMTEKNYDEEAEDDYRSKRSLESQNFMFHMRNPKMKSILTSRLATLLEELDEEETDATNKEKDNKNSIDKVKENETEDHKSDNEAVAKSNIINYNKVDKRKRRLGGANKDEDMLHLAMHNILLQGIIGHMDLNDVYRKIHLLVNNFKKPDDKIEDKNRNDFRKHLTPAPIVDDMTENIDHIKTTSLENQPRAVEFETKLPHQTSQPNEESKFFKEMAECDELQSDIAEKGNMNKFKSSQKKKEMTLPNVMIKTIIDITSRNKQKHNYSNSKENVKGIIQLIYNGKPVKFSRMDDDLKSNQKITENTLNSTIENTTNLPNNDKTTESEINDILDNLSDKYQLNSNSDSYLSNLLANYMKNNPARVNNIVREIERKGKHKTKRFKREIKIHYEDGDVATKNTTPKRKSSAKTDDDELYVEIETHFDSKGLKGEKKKKLIRNLIAKIQKAIHSDIDIVGEEKKKKLKHVKKRTQHPLGKNRTLFINKVMTPYDTVVQRQSDPISKSVIENQPVPFIVDKSGESWKKAYFGPGFLTVSKSLNSAELSEVNVDYNKEITLNGIPQRIQKPLNTDASEETENKNTYFDLGNLHFFIKDLDGTGLSIGFNQYMDEPPDPETMKAFTGIENIINSYHQNDKQLDEDNLERKYKTEDSIEKEHDISKREVSRKNEHLVIRRSVKELKNKDYHSNEYKIIFDSNYLPYDNYEETIEDKNRKVSFSINKNNEDVVPLSGHDMPIVRDNIQMSVPSLIDDNIFYNKLKPSEILSLASILNRKKRAVTVKKITNIRSKLKLNKYINTKPITKKRILKKKRSKRQIDKIRIIATDALAKARHSSDNIFLDSNENLLADRAVIREVEIPETISEIDEDEVKSGNIRPNTVPYTYDEASITKIFENQIRHNPLMSKYPHIIMEEIPRSDEEYDPVMINKIEIKPLKHVHNNRIESSTQINTIKDKSLPTGDEIMGAISPIPKQNYKLTVKIMPKNTSDLNSGFKEIHTSINKSFNKNGVVYSSLVNVSEISKIEKLHNLLAMTTISPLLFNAKPSFGKKIEDQQIKMDVILKQHKKRIDDQLEHLKKEKVNLEALALKTLQQKPSEDLTTKSSLLPQIAKFDIGKLLASALMHLQSQGVATTTTATTLITTAPTTIKEPDPEKIQFISSIQKNENLTNEILHQINKNTEILQNFLAKLSDKMARKDIRQASEEVKPTTEDPNKFWKQYHVPFWGNTFPNAEYPRNITNGQIPFIYAFQQPYNGDKQNIPVASVVYHGHIHTNNFHKTNPGDLGQNKPKYAEGANGTQVRYFMDEFEDNYKILPPKKQKDGVMDSSIPLIVKNNTNVN